MMNIPPVNRWMTSVTILLCLTACQQTTIPLNSHISLPSAFDHAQGQQGQQDLRQWWRGWQDPVLNQLIEQGLNNNHTIQIAASRLQEARAINRLAYANLGVSVGATGGLSSSTGKIDNPIRSEYRAQLAQYPQTASLSQAKLESENNIVLRGGLAVSWEPDIFGQKRSDADAARYAMLGSQEQFYGAQLLITGEIANYYAQARAVQARQRSANQTIAALQKLQQYLQGRFRAGQVTAYEVNQIQMRLTAAQAKYSTLQAEYDIYVRQIAVLTGHTPQGFTLPPAPQQATNLPHAPSGLTPQGLLERRPDIRAHAAQVHAQAARLASAQADLLPRFNIEFIGQTGRIEVRSDSGLTAWGALLSVGIHMPIFSNGRIRANIAAADARLQTALLQYDQTLLTALAEVDNAYQNTFALQQQHRLLHTTYRQAQKHTADSQKLFQYGNITLDKAIEAQLNQTQIQENLIQARLAHTQAMIKLYQALGGGWQAIPSSSTN